jgi:hypothetical protein
MSKTRGQKSHTWPTLKVLFSHLKGGVVGGLNQAALKIAKKLVSVLRLKKGMVVFMWLLLPKSQYPGALAA